MTGHRESLPISVAQVLRRAGVQHPLRRTVELDELRVGDAAVEADTAIDVDLVLEATGHAVVASGVIHAIARCGCRRCLDPFEQPLATPVREIFEPVPVEGETYPLHAEQVDLLPLVRDALLLALPLAPLCRDDCPGPAPDVFPALLEAAPPRSVEPVTAEDEPVEAAAGRDPRWAALDQLRLKG